jgi:uncharacterized phage protein (TIGR02218 family)
VRRWPPALIAHLQQSVTTTCRLLKITLADGRAYGLTSLDRDITYQGVTYSAKNGVDASVIATDSGLSVDNGEGYSLFSASAASGITRQMIDAGELDDAQWQMMVVNWADLSMGHGLLDAGDTGNIKTAQRSAYTVELVSYVMRLRQPIGGLDSRTCRATFGNPAAGQLGCGVNADALWRAGTITGVSTEEPRRVFADSSLLITPQPIPGRLQWLTGKNAARNRLYQIEAYSAASGTIALIEQVPYDIETGDTFRIRPDCDKTLADCKKYGNVLNMKAEPYIPVGDGLETQTPNAQIPGGVLGSEVID